MNKMLTVLIALALSASLSYATIYYVDAGKSDDTGNGTSWATAKKTFQAGLDLATASGDQIWVKAGTYKPTSAYDLTNTSRYYHFRLKNNVAIYGGFAGTETATTQRTTYGVGEANETILSGDIGTVGTTTDNCYHVIYNPDQTTDINSTAVLDGFTITSGNADGGSESNNGGGIYNSSSSPTLTNITISGNSANYGGGIYNVSSSPALTNVTISNNSAGYGGGIYNQYSPATMNNITISSNYATYYGGGMINISCDPTLTNVTIDHNSVTINEVGKGGGGIYNYSSSPILNSVTIDHNSVTGASEGGGIFNYSSSPSLTNVTISNNSANSGGGIFNYQYSSPSITNVTIRNNTARSQGGGIYNEGYSQAFLTNVTISNNDASSQGGGIYNSSVYAWGPINVTISNNWAYSGGGIFHNSSSSLTLYNCIIWGNTADVSGRGNQIAIFGGGTITLDYSCYTSGLNDVYTEGSTFTSTTNNNITRNPKFVNVYTYTGVGASYGDYRLNGNSPCVNMGYNSYNAKTTDIRGMDRIQNTTIDMGAYEWTSGTDPAPTLMIIYVNASAAGSNNGSSWTNAFTSFQNALDLAESGDQIWVAKGTYKPSSAYDLMDTPRYYHFRLKNNVAIYGGFAGGETATNQRANFGIGEANETILSGDIGTADVSTDNCCHIIYNPDQYPDINSTAVLDGFTIKGGNANGSDPHYFGGGIYNNYSSPTITNVTISNNLAYFGGGIYNTNYSSPTLTNVTISNNSSTTTYGKGGGIYNYSYSSPTLTNVTISNNSATGTSGHGGGIYNQYSSSTLKNCIVWGNTANAATDPGNQFYITSVGTTTLNYSCYATGADNIYNSGGTFTATNHNITIDPKFADADSSDYRICGDSPAVNAGNNDDNDKTTDIRGKDRIQNTTIDMGAYEWTSGADPVRGPMTIYVNTSATGSNNGSTWTNAFTSLQDALDFAVSKDQIWVAKGTYKPSSAYDLTNTPRFYHFRLKNRIAVYGSFSGTETAVSERTNYGTGEINETKLSGDLNGNDNYSTPGTTLDENCYHVIYNPDQSTDINSTAILDGFTIIGGNANGSDPHIYGGGIYNDHSSPTLTNITVSNNSATSNGGGIYNTSSSPALINITISSNSVSSNGGGMYNTSSSPTLTNVTISNNSASSQGGGIYNYSSSSPTLKNSIVWGNTASATTDPGNQFYISDGTTTLNYSCYANGIGDVYGTPSLSSCITTDPKFVDAGSGDYRLYGSSPCVNTGSNTYNTTSTDIRGKTRIQNTTIDRGAYEWTSGTDPDRMTIYVNASATGGNSGSNWTNAYTSLQSALTAAGSNDQIWVAKGTYKPTTGTSRGTYFQMKNNVAIYGGFSGTETAVSQRTTYGFGEANETILSGDLNSNDNYTTPGTTLDDNCYHVIYNPDLTPDINSTAILDGFTIKGGNANGTDPHSLGGGIYNYRSSPTLTNVTISNNSATTSGGGIYNSYSSPTLTNVTISNNSATYYGGGIYNTSSSSPTLSNVTINNNSVTYTSGKGGGMYNSSSSLPTLTNVTISGNSANGTSGQGGGMYNSNSSPTLTNVTISDNSANGNSGKGGGIYNDRSSPTLTNVTISNNLATGTSGQGGGMHNYYSSSPTLTNVTISGNSATGSTNGKGGGIYNDRSSSPNLINVTISNNSAKNGGGICNISPTYPSSPTLKNCIVWGNTASATSTPGKQFYFVSGTTTLNYSCYANGTNDIYSTGGTFTATDHNTTTDPKFVNATGGDYRIYGDSPCVNTGLNSYNTSSTDIRGKDRIQNTTIDRGAYEWTSGTDPIPVSAPTAQATDIVFSNSMSGENKNIIVSYTASASAERYLIVRRTGSAPTFSPSNGAEYTAGTSQGDDYIVFAGTAVTATDANAPAGTNYYAVFAYNGVSPETKYLTTSPLTGNTILSSGATASVGNTNGAPASVSFPDAGVHVTFPNGTAGTDFNVTKTASAPACNFTPPPGVRRMKNLFFTITSTNATPGSYTLALDFSSLTGMTEAKWNNFKIMKRANANCAWQDVTQSPLSATIANRQTDGVYGKFTISGLSSFSEFGGGEGATTYTVTSAAETGDNTLKNLITGATAGDIITFNITAMGGNTITLTTPVVIDKDLTIRGIDGGIILNGNGATRVMTINNSVIVRLENLKIQSGNDASNIVGGILNQGDLTMINCVVSGNTETGAGLAVGGILQSDDENDVLNLVNCTITGNAGEATNGVGGLYGDGTVKIYNSIIYGNTGGYTDIDQTMTVSEAYNSCIGNLGSITITSGGNNISSNPQFVGASNNATHPYSIGGISPCADAGDDSYCFESTDIRGGSFGRKLNKVTGETGTIDMGAYEYKFDSDASLPVELTSFTAESQNGGVVLKWSTESEIENLGFIIDKRLQVTGDWLQVAGYLTDKALEGHGSTSAKHEYQFTDKAVQPGVTYLYRLADVDYSGKFTWHKEVEVRVEAESAQIPAKFGLHAAYPNPFNPSVNLSYGLTKNAQTKLQIYNLRGQLVETLKDGFQTAGNYNITWQPRNLSTGVYIVRLESGKETNLQKVVFVK